MKKLFLPALLIIAINFLFSCSEDNKPENNRNANRNLVIQYHKVWSNGQVKILDTILSPDFVCHFIAGIEWKGIDGANKSITGHRKAFPDWKEEIVDMISEGDRVVTRYKSTGTHQATFNELDSTGNKVEIYETSIYRIANGKIVEQWGFPDEVSLQTQLRVKK